MSRKPTVIVSEQSRPVTIPTAEGLIEVGQAVTRVYEGEDAQRHSFIAKDTGNEFSMGVTSEDYEFINHTDALEPLLDRGYTITKQTQGRGGMQLYTILEPQNPISLPDPIAWDHDLWPMTHKKEKLRESLFVTSSVKPGKGLRFERGFFRMICTNGLVAKVLELGGASFTHSNFSVAKMEQALFGGEKGSNSSILGPQMGTKKGVHQLLGFVDQIIEQGGDELGKDLHFYARRDLGPLTDIPNWWLLFFRQQIETFIQNGPDKVHALDVLNMVTSPISMAQRQAAQNNERPPAEFRALMKISALTEAASRIISFGSI